MSDFRIWAIALRYGVIAAYAASHLKRLALEAGVFPAPVTHAFIVELAAHLSSRSKRLGTAYKDRCRFVRRSGDHLFQRTLDRIEKKPLRAYDFFDELMTAHDIAPLPPLISDAPELPTGLVNLELEMENLFNKPTAS